MTSADLVLRSRRVVTPRGTGPAAVHVRAGRIVGVYAIDDVPDGCPVDDAGESVIMPGLVDTHVHVNEPGRTEWEGFATATRAAAAGGVTTIVDMPLNSIPATTTVAALEAKRRAAAGQCFVDVGFWGGVVPGNTCELQPLFDAGVSGFKCFLVPSGVDEFCPVTEADLRTAMPVLAAIGAPLLVHAELPGPIDAAAAERSTAHRVPVMTRFLENRRYASFVESRPKAAEDEAVALLVRLCREYRVRTHIVHLSSARAVTPIVDARSAGLPISVETCPHYLYFAAERVPDGATAFKCAPPIREEANREGLLAALGAKTIQMVVSDHSPAPPSLKHAPFGDLFRAWGGIASLQLSLPATWTAVRGRGCTLNDLTEWMCAAPARLAGFHTKGAIAPGFDADLVIWEPEAEFTVDARRLHHRHPITPYDRDRLSGVVRRTYLGGVRIAEDGGAPGQPCGRLLARQGSGGSSV